MIDPKHHQQVLTLLAQARMLNNMTVKDHGDVSSWHRQVDAMLREYPDFDHPAERWDTPERTEQRARVNRLFRK